MKFATFSYQGSDHVGVVDASAGRVRPVSGVADMVDLIARYDALKSSLGSGADIALGDVKLLAPIPVPKRNVICVGKNYLDHAREFAGSGFEAGAVRGAEIDEYPAVFSKGPNAVIGPTDDVDMHSEITSSVDYEVELTIVIGKSGRNIAKADAYNHVFGYTIANDVTARDRQKRHKQWFLGKTLDTFCPMGPWIATGDELDPENLAVKAWVNGELRQNANTRDLIFDIPTLVSTISQGMTLVPGDLIATGTPAGVGIGFNPPKFLKSGDVVTMEISGIGRIENRFV
ncbi:MAG: fumarylacetoacetate hydrolase family protein [Afipia sp.]|nr:fumarylacetoacetate hydrolase family protein [Afipia sp.]OJW64731.1 MAG: hydrolase [Afipia sp. 64-13]